MPTVTLKADEEFCRELDDMAKELAVSRSELVRRAVRHYGRSLEREHLKIAMRRASYRVRGSETDIDDLDRLAADGLDDD